MIKKILDIKNLLSLDAKEYSIDGYKTYLVPSVSIITTAGPNNRGVQTDLGLTISSPNNEKNCRYWTTACRVNSPIQLYRGLQFLSRCSDIQEDTLCACYYAADRRLRDETTSHYLNSLKDAGFEDAEDFRKELLSKDIDQDALDLINLIAKEVDEDALVFIKPFKKSKNKSNAH